jgi:hypothetical protein
MVRLIAFFLIFGLTVSSVFAQTDSSNFTISFFGSSDTEAPSTPVLSGSAIATVQINASWTTATDNLIVSGYVLFRDGLPIATTTQTSYSDVGLVASTTYSYFVRAFDPSLNYSSSSNIITITTPANPTPPTSGSGGGTATRVVLNSLDVEPYERSAIFSIHTVRPARFEVRWGRTGSYELGYIVNDIYVSSYKTTLTDLEPGTVYQYEVIGYTPFGTATVLEKGHFSTINIADSFSPTNVQAFTAKREGANVKLNWLSPQEEDVSSIRVVRSHLGFPTHTQDGVVVYQGLSTSFEDKNILSQYSPVYYTAFVVDAFGNVSSGAIARVYALREGVSDSGVSDPPIPSGTNGEIKEDTVASTSPNIEPDTRMPELEEIFIWQNEIKQSIAIQGVFLDSEEPFLLSIPKSAVSDNLKTIIVSLTNPTHSREIYSFMLRINKDQTAYEALLPPTMLEGKSRLVIDIYDYESLIVANYQKTIEFRRGEIASETPIFPDRIISFISNKIGFVLLLPAILLGFVLFFIYLKRRKLEDNL